MQKKNSNNFIYNYQTIKEALVKLDNIAEGESKTLFVISNEEQIMGTITDGDIRRGLINESKVSDSVSSIMKVEFQFLKKGEFNIDEIRKLREDKIQLVPLLDKQNKIIKIIDFSKQKSILPIDAMIMAGGRGERLRPLTESTPKPMLVVGDKPIIEHNLIKMCNYGIESINISLGYLPDQIIEHLGSGTQWGCNINYTMEDRPLGTIGSLRKVENLSHDTILLMNGDILTNLDFEEFYYDFKNKNAAISIASIPYMVNVPYAVMESENGRVVSLNEKPTYTYYSNAGIYLIKKEYIELIPENALYNATDLIEALIKLGHDVITFPILGYWIDIGRPDDFKKVQEDIKHLKL